MESALRQIIEYLIVHIKNDNRRFRRSAELEGDLLVLVNAVNSSLRIQRECLFCVVTVAAAGQWISSNQTDHFYKAVEKLLLQLSLSVVQADMESADLIENFNSPALRLTFEITERSRIVMTDCLTIKHFLHRISIVHPQVKIQFNVKVNGNLSTHIFGNGNVDKFCSYGHAILSDSAQFVRDFQLTADSRCCRLHPIAGKPFPLSIPNKLAEEGACGVLEILSIAAICPCIKNYPNKPTRVSNISGVIVNKIFFQFSVNLLKLFNEGLACPDISYTLQSILEDDWSECGEVQEQMLLLFLFIQFWDDFHLELVDITGGQQTIVDHLDQILNYNKDIVGKSIQLVLHQLLDEYFNLKKNRRRIQTATAVICDAVQSILSSSTDRDFRTKSLQLLKVSDTQEMRTSLKNTLQHIIQKRFLPSRVCDTKRIHSGLGDHAQSNTGPASPETSRENLYHTQQFHRIHTEPTDSESDSSIPVDSDRLHWAAEPPPVTAETDCCLGSTEERIGTKKRQLGTYRMKPCASPYSSPFKKAAHGPYSQTSSENVSLGHNPFLKTDVQVSTPAPTRLTSQRADLFGAHCSVMSTELTFNRRPTEDQEEYLWLQEVSNLSDWTH